MKENFNEESMYLTDDIPNDTSFEDEKVELLEPVETIEITDDMPEYVKKRIEAFNRKTNVLNSVSINISTDATVSDDYIYDDSDDEYSNNEIESENNFEIVEDDSDNSEEFSNLF